MKLTREKAGTNEDFKYGVGTVSTPAHRGRAWMSLEDDNKARFEYVSKSLIKEWNEEWTTCPNTDESLNYFEESFIVYNEDLEKFKEDYKEAKKSYKKA